MSTFAAALGPRTGFNTSCFPCTLEEAQEDLRRMAANPAPLQRPVLVLGAYHAWAPVTWSLVHKIRRLTGASETQVQGVSFLLNTTLHSAATSAANFATRTFPPSSPQTPDPKPQPPSLDLIGISMGGLIARMITAADNAALGLPLDLPHISAARIFTFGSPLSGARIAQRIRPDRAARDMCPGSPLLQRLGPASPRGPELFCYAQLRDQIVGATRTAPEGMTPIWTTGTRLFSHFTTHHNPWFLADMARRLRNEPPLFSAPTQPPPRD